MGKKLRKVFSLILMLALIVTMTPASAVSAAGKPTLNKTSRNILRGESYNFNIRNKVKGSVYEWSSSDKKVATVDQRGIVTGVKKGKAKITCLIKTARDTYKLSAAVNICEPAKGFEINNKIETIKVGETYDLNRTLSPSTSNDKTKWTTSDDTIAAPDKYGKFTALRSGTVTIIGTTMGGATDAVIIKVVEGESITITSNDVENGVVRIDGGIYNDIVISNSVGDASINLIKVKVTGALQMESGADYTVKTVKSEIADVKVFNPEIVSMATDEDEEIDQPTLYIGAGTVVVNIDANGNVNIEQSSSASIENIKVTVGEDGKISVFMNNVKCKMIVHSESKSEVEIKLDQCEIEEAVIEQSQEDSVISFIDQRPDQAESLINKISVKNNSQLKIDVKTDEVEVAKEVTKADITISKAVKKVTNHGSETKISTEGQGSIGETDGDQVDTTTDKDDTPSTPGGSSGPGSNPDPTPTPTPSIPGIDENNGTYTFDASVIGFTVTVGNKSYDLTRAELLSIAKDWDNNTSTYTVPGTNGEIKLTRGVPYHYQVEVAGQGTFTMVVDVSAQTVKVSGGTKFSITNVIREYSIDSTVSGVKIVALDGKAFNVTLSKLQSIRDNWDNSVAQYTYHDSESGKSVTFTRTIKAYTYKVKIAGIDEFTIEIDQDKWTIRIIGGIDFTIEEIK